MNKFMWYARMFATFPCLAVAWAAFGLAMLLEPKGPKP